MTHSRQTCSRPVAVGVTSDETTSALLALSQVHRGVSASEGSRRLLVGLVSILETVHTLYIYTDRTHFTQRGLDESHSLHLKIPDSAVHLQ